MFKNESELDCTKIGIPSLKGSLDQSNGTRISMPDGKHYVSHLSCIVRVKGEKCPFELEVYMEVEKGKIDSHSLPTSGYCIRGN